MPRFTDLLPPLPTPAEMSRWDSAAYEMFGIPPLLLMENAAGAALRELMAHYPLTRQSRVLVVTGRGNNGGDGWALARMLHDEGIPVLLVRSYDVDSLPSPAKEHADMAHKLGVPVLDLPEGEHTLPQPWARPHVVVDAVCGTGLKGALRTRAINSIRLINALAGEAFVFSLDIPSGLCGLTGRPLPEAVKANATICFEAGKPGLFLPEAAEYTGNLVVRRVGIPLAVRAAIPASWKLLRLEPGAVAQPSPFRHKGSAGKVCILGASPGMTGAALLAAAGALRAGAGLVHLLVPAGLEASMRALFPEVLIHAVGSLDVWSSAACEQIMDILEKLRPGALVVGPGMGRTKGTRQVLAALLGAQNRPPAVVDADALYFLRMQAGDAAERLSADSLVRQDDILTPHPLELARMLPDAFFTSGPVQSEDFSTRTRLVQERRAEALACALDHVRGVVVLKGAGTLAGRSGTPFVLCPTACPALATGGSGDVLAGACAALVAAGMESFDAASLGILLHAMAGSSLMRKGPVGHSARDIADAIPAAWAELCN